MAGFLNFYCPFFKENTKCFFRVLTTQCALTTVFPDSWRTMRNPFSMFSVPISFPSYFWKDPYLKFQAINSNSREESITKSTTFATTEMVGVNICSNLSLAFLLPSPVSCFREQRAGVGRGNAFPRTLLHNQLKIPSPAPASEVSGIVHSVTGYQPRPVDPFRCGISCTSVFAFVLDGLLSKAGT